MHLFRISKDNLFLFLIIALAVFLRFFRITDIPPSLNWDEISHGYNAYSILKSGHDEWGERWPIIFRAYGDYKLPVYIYTAAISEFLFGVNEFAMRLPSVIAGVTLVILSFFLGKQLFGKTVGLLTALLVAVEPWSLFLSRGAFEANLGQAFLVSGVVFFFWGLKKPTSIIISACLFGLSVWTYNSERIFAPLLLFSLILIYRRELQIIWENNKKILLATFVILTIFFGGTAYQLMTNVGQARYGWVAILDEGAISQINQSRGDSNLAPMLARIVHNKATYFIENFAQNYISHFLPNFLFINGGSNYQFNIPDTGILYLINIPFILLGLWYLWKTRNRTSILIFVWIILAPIPSSLTREAPHTLRAITFLPVPMLLSAIGITELLRLLKKKFVLPMVLLILGFLCINYLNSYFNTYPKQYSQVWQYGYKQAVLYVRENYDKYDKIIVSKKYGEPHEFFLFYWTWDSEKYISDPNLIRFNQSNWYWVDRFDKFYFVNDWEVPRTENGKWKMENGKEVPIDRRTLLITSPGNYPPDWKKLDTIYFLDGSPAFDILEK